MIELPQVADFEYGVFVFQTVDGKHFGYSSAPGNPAWELVSTIIEENLPVRIAAASGTTRQYQKVVCSCADSYDGSGFHSDTYFCPVCRSRIDEMSPTNKIRKPVPELTFTRLFNMSEDQQKNHVLEAWHKHT